MKTRMHNYFLSVLNIAKKKKVFIPLIVVLLGWLFIGGNTDASFENIKVTEKDFIQEVSLTGKVKAISEVSMGFELSGRVSDIKKQIGDLVEVDEVIASISNADKYASVVRARSEVEAQSAKLSEIRRGSRAEDIRIAETDVITAENTQTQSLQSLVGAIKEAYDKTDDMLRSKADPLFKNPRSVNPEIFPINDNYPLQLSVNSQRLRMGEKIVIWQKSALSLTPETYTDERIKEARTIISDMQTFLNGLTFAVSTLQESSALPQSTIDSYKSNITTARTTANALNTTLTSAEQAYNSASTGLRRAKETLDLKKIGSTAEQIQGEEARLKGAQANLLSAQADYNKTLIKAPFKGVVTKIDIKKGEIVSPNTPVIDVIAKDSYEVETYASETDIAKLKQGQSAYMTFDACNKDEKAYEAIMSIDPAETLKDGVNTYKVLLTLANFKLESCEVKSGMTANIVIQTAKKPGSIVIRQEAIKLENSRKIVLVLKNGKTESVSVSTGGIDTAGNIEVLSGLSAGDVIQIPVKK